MSNSHRVSRLSGNNLFCMNLLKTDFFGMFPVVETPFIYLFICFTFHRSSGIKPLRYRNSHIQTRYIKYVVTTLTSIQPS